MNKKQFALLLTSIIGLIILTFALQVFFNDQTKKFDISGGAFFLSIFCLFSYKNALNPTESFGSRNTTKKYYEKKGELQKYQSLCKILFISTISVGTMTLIYGLGEIFIIYLKSIFAN